MILIWLIFFYVVFYYLKEYLEKRKSPPGPLPIPILGNLIQIANASEIPSLAFAKFAKDYGEVFQLRMGMKTLVVPASVEAINTIFSHPEAAGRDQSGSWHDRNFNKNLGVIFSDGPLWEKTKLWTIRSLRDYGFGKSASVETIVTNELESFFQGIDKIRSTNNNIVPISGLFVLSVFKIMWKMIKGNCTEEDEVVISNLLEKSEAAIRKGVFGAGIIVAYPFMRHIIPEQTGHTYQMDFFRAAHKAGSNILQEAVNETTKRNDSTRQPKNLIEAFAYKMEEEKNDPNTIFFEKNFICLYMDLLQAGSDTNSAFLESFMLFMVLYPDVQAKIYNEIQTIMGDNQEGTSFADYRKKMIYTTASMLEIHRHTTVVQNLVTRRVTKDFYYKKYLIKKGTIMVANLHTAYFSPECWDNPMEFLPERFIGSNGNIIKQNYIMPFGVGRRICPGQTTSDTVTFNFFIAILKRYKLSIVPGEARPRQDMHEGFSSKPFPFQITLTNRT